MAMKATANRQRIAVALVHALLIAVVFSCFTGTAGADGLLTAEKLMRAGKFSEAAILLTPLTIREPSNFRAHLLLGEIYYRQGDLAQASASLKRAYALNPNDVRTVALLGTVRYAQGEDSAAIKHLSRAISLGDTSAATAYVLGLSYQRAGNLMGARDTLARSALMHSEHTATVVALARLEARLGHHAEAAYWYRKAISQRPNDLDLFRAAIASTMAAGDFLSAELLLKAHLQKHTGDSDAWRALADCYGQLGLTIEARKVYLRLDELGTLTAAERKSLIVGYLNQAMWSEATAQYRKLKSTAGDAPLHAAIAQAYVSTGQLDAALKAAKTAAKQSPAPEYRQLLADILTTAGKHSDAYGIYAELVGEAPTPKLLMSAAKAAIRCGKDEQGIALLKRLVATAPSDVQLRVLLAQTSEDFGDIHEALAQWSVAAELDKNDNRIRLALVRLAMVAGHHTWATTELKRLDVSTVPSKNLIDVVKLAIAVGDTNTGMKAAEALLKTDDLPPSTKAIAADMLTKAGYMPPEAQLAAIFNADPSNPLACRIYTQSLIHNGKGEVALSMCKRAIAATPDSAEMYAILLDICAALKNPQAATDIITAAIGFEGENAVAMDFLRVAYETAYGADRAADEMLTLARVKTSAPRIASAARACEKAGRWSAAAQLYESMMAERGSFAIRDAAIAYMEAGNLEQARTLLLAALASSEHWQGLSSVLANLPAKPQTLRAIADLLNYAPDGAAFGGAVAKLLADRGMVKEGMTYFDAIKPTDRTIATTVGRAYLLAHSGHELAACAELERLNNSTDLATPETLLALAECYLQAGNYAAAEATARNAGGTSDDIHARRLVIAGQAAMRGGRPDTALDYFAAALLSQPGNQPAADGIAALCQAQAVELTQVRRCLTRIYRYSDEPGTILAIARKIALIPGYDEIAAWASLRADKANLTTDISDAAPQLGNAAPTQ